jgi:hypothetical protein
MKKYLAKSLLILQQFWKNYEAYNKYFIYEHCFHPPKAGESSDLIDKGQRAETKC